MLINLMLHQQNTYCVRYERKLHVTSGSWENVKDFHQDKIIDHKRWMDGWLGSYSPFSIIGHIGPGCQWMEMSKMDDYFEHRPRPRANLNLGPLVHKSRALTLNPDS